MTDAPVEWQPSEREVRHVLNTLALPLDEFHRMAARHALLAMKGYLRLAAELLSKRLRLGERP